MATDSGITARSALRWVTLLLFIASVALSWPMLPVVALAAWVAALTRPLFDRATRLLSGRTGAASAMVVLLVLVIFVPLSFAVVSLGGSAIDLVNRLLQSDTARTALNQLVTPGTDTSDTNGNGLHVPNPSDLVAAAQKYGTQAVALLTTIAGAAAKGIIGLFVFFAAVYTYLISGPSAWKWIVDHSPLNPKDINRLAASFHETGRGLLVGVGLTSAAQGAIATIAYLALGVPRALVLGLLTGVCSIIPVVGTGVIWVPLALGLFLNGTPVKALILIVVGIVGIGSVDNLLRPIFARLGALRMPTLLLFVSIFGGLATLGPWGALLGPLVVRLTMEALVLLKGDEVKPTEP